MPELEYLASLRLEGSVLDHCCGDGYIAALAFPGRTLAAGVDLSAGALAQAHSRGNYHRLERADAGERLPFADASFDAVINNSGIEHIPDLERTMAEIARVLRPGGALHFNVLNSRFFDWWPHQPASARRYREFQPFHHALDESGWEAVLARHGFGQVRFRDYFPRPSSEVLADYDRRYSEFYILRRPRPGPAAARLAPRALLVKRWRRKFAPLAWEAAPRAGAGFLVSAVRCGP